MFGVFGVTRTFAWADERLAIYSIYPQVSGHSPQGSSEFNPTTKK